MKPRRITVHCSASQNGQRVDIDTIDKWHRQRGFASVGYHFVIQPDGEVQRGRALNEQGAHVEGDNEGNVGICLIGTDKFTFKQLDSLRYYIDGVRQIHDIPAHEIYTHAQFASAIKQGKTCPGFTINRLLAWYLCNDRDALKPHLLEPHKGT